MLLKRMLTALLVLGLFGCGGSAAPNMAGYTKYDAEYRKARGDLMLPPGESWPSHIREPRPGGAAPGEEPDEAALEDGLGTIDTQFYWLCRWAKYYLEVPSGSAEARDAAVQLKTVKDTYLWTNGIDDQLRKMFAEALAETESGASVAWRRLFGQEKCVI